MTHAAGLPDSGGVVISPPYPPRDLVSPKSTVVSSGVATQGCAHGGGASSSSTSTACHMVVPGASLSLSLSFSFSGSGVSPRATLHASLGPSCHSTRLKMRSLAARGRLPPRRDGPNEPMREPRATRTDSAVRASLDHGHPSPHRPLRYYSGVLPSSPRSSALSVPPFSCAVSSPRVGGKGVPAPCAKHTVFSKRPIQSKNFHPSQRSVAFFSVHNSCTLQFHSCLGGAFRSQQQSEGERGHTHSHGDGEAKEGGGRREDGGGGG